jgi:hypothetical protein
VPHNCAFWKRQFDQAPERRDRSRALLTVFEGRFGLT